MTQVRLAISDLYPGHIHGPILVRNRDGRGAGHEVAGQDQRSAGKRSESRGAGQRIRADQNAGHGVGQRAAVQDPNPLIKRQAPSQRIRKGRKAQKAAVVGMFISYVYMCVDTHIH